MEETRENRLKLIILLLGISTISFGIITFEISLTRILSVMFSYHYTFLAVSLALFGLGLGGALTQIFHKKISADKAFGTLALTCSISSLTPLFFAFILASAPGSNIISDSLIVFFPFLIAGVLMATIYKVFVSLSNALYFADLSGAAVGALAASFMLNLGASKVILLASIFIAIASLFFALTSKRKTIIVVASASIILLGFLAKYPISVNPLDISQEDEQEKELAMILGNQLLGAKIVDTRWSAFGRTDLVELESDPHEKWIFVDGSAGTRMYHFDGNFSSSNSEVPSLKYTTQFYPYYFARKTNSLVIGPGGGLDILTSLMGGMNHTTAVEVNQDIVNIVRDYSEYNGGIYTRYSNVHVYVDEGRSFIRRSTQKYDIIMLNIPITKTSQGTVGYALAENYLFTTDSFMDFLDHLNEDGLLTIVAHGRFEVYRLVSIVFKVLEDKGLSPQEIMRHMAVVEGAGHSGLPVFILGKTSFTDEQARFMYVKSRGLGFVPAYLPYIDGVTLDPLLKALADGKVSLDYLISLAPFDMRPPTDDSPFFYKFERGVPPTLLQFMIGAMALSAVVSFLYVGGRRRRQSVARNKELPSHLNKLFLFKLYFFASLGLGFMLIEISLIQRFILFLGHPTPAIAASLFSLLLACGLGSFYSRRWNNNKLYNAFKASLVIGSIAILYMFTLPYLLNVFLSYDTGLRFLFSFVLIFPLGFAMGIPFPTGLRFFGKEPDNDVAWMWCINGVFSVLGSILAMIIAMSFGFSGVLLLGGLTYFGVFLVGRTRAAML